MLGYVAHIFYVLGYLDELKVILSRLCPKKKNRQAKMANKIGVKIKKFKLKYNTSFGRSAS